jgi:hypothetical protein
LAGVGVAVAPVAAGAVTPPVLVTCAITIVIGRRRPNCRSISRR